MPDVSDTDERRRPRQTSFGSLSAGMIVRGSVPDSVLYGAEAPRPQTPSSLREINANVTAALAQRPVPAEPTPVVALKPEGVVAPPVPPGPRKAVTVRLDPVHHMRLRLVGSYTRRSTQDILVAALNAYLDKLPASVPGGGPAFHPEAD